MTTGNGYNSEGFTDYEDNLNWDAVGSPVPEGNYDVEVLKSDYKPTSAGKHMAKVQFKIEAAAQMENEDPEAFQQREEKSKDRIIFENFVFTQEAGFRVKNFAEMAGVDLPTFVTKQIVEEWAAGIMGLKVSVNLKHREWQGSKQASVSKFFPYQSGGAVPEQQQAEEQQMEAEQEAPPPPAPKPQSTLRQAVQPKVNGTTNGAAHKPAAKPTPPKSNKPQARR